MRGSRQMHTSAGRSNDSYDLHSTATAKLDSVRKRLLSTFTSRQRHDRELMQVKLQSRLLELEKTVQTQRIQIAALLEQKCCLQKICQRQQDKLSHRLDEDSMMVEELTRQIETLRIERERSTEVMEAISIEKEIEVQALRQELERVAMLNRQLEENLTALTKQNQNISQQLSALAMNPSSSHLERELAELRGHNIWLQEELEHRRHVQRKFRMSLQQIERLQAAIKSLSAGR